MPTTFEYWDCPGCRKNNYLGRSSCKKCGLSAPPEVAFKRKLEAPTPSDEVEAIIVKTMREVAGTDTFNRADMFLNKGGTAAILTDTAVPGALPPPTGLVLEAPPPSAPETIEAETKSAEPPPAIAVDLLEDENSKVINEFISGEEGASGLTLAEEVGAIAAGDARECNAASKPDILLDVSPASLEPVDEVVESELAEKIPEGGLPLVAVKRSTERLVPGTFKVCNVAETSFELRWEPPVQERPFDSFRLTVFEHRFDERIGYEVRDVRCIVITKERSWTVMGLDPGCKFSASVTCRSVLLTLEGQPHERMVEFFIPLTTLTARVTTKPQPCELAYWFDGQVNSYFSSRPFKRYLGTLQEEDGTYEQETHLGLLEMAVRFGLRGTSACPGLAHSGVCALELFSPYSLGAGCYVDFEVLEPHKSIYQVEVMVMQVRPFHDDYAIAPDHVQKSALKAAEHAQRMRIEAAGADAAEDEPSSGKTAAAAVLETSCLDRELLGGGAWLHVRDRENPGQFVTSKHAEQMGSWEKLFVRTQFASQKMRAYIQLPAHAFGPLLLDSFKVTYVGPSDLFIKIRDVRPQLSAASERDTTETLSLGLVCGEDLINSTGGLYRSPVLAKLFWGGEFLAQTSISIGGADDPWFGANFTLPVDRSKAWHEGLRVQVVDAMTLAVVGDLRLSFGDVLHHPASPQCHPIHQKVPKKRKQSCCARCCRSKAERKVVPDAANPPRASVDRDVDRDEDEVVDEDDVRLEEMEQGGEESEEAEVSPRGRVVLTVSRMVEDVSTDAFAELLDLRDAVLRREKKGARKLARLFEQPRGDLDDLEFKLGALRLGVIEAAVSRLADETVGKACAEVLSRFMIISDETQATTGGASLFKFLRFVCHRFGVARACWSMARARARKVEYAVGKAKTLLPLEHLELLSKVYVRNRALLNRFIAKEEPCFVELMVRCLPADEDGYTGFGGNGGHFAERLLEEVGLGSTLPQEILNEYYRLRRIIPLDDKFWKCEALRTLPPALPPRIIFLFEPDRTASLPPAQPDMTPWERCVWRCEKCVSWSFNLTALTALFMALLAMLRNGSQCPLTWATLFLSSISLTSVCYATVLRKMADIGVGSQVAIVCCPLVCCNVLLLIGSVVWSALVMFVETEGLENCDVRVQGAARALLAFIGLGIASTFVQSCRLQGTRLFNCCMNRFCCCLKGLCRSRRCAGDDNAASSNSQKPVARRRAAPSAATSEATPGGAAPYPAAAPGTEPEPDLIFNL